MTRLRGLECVLSTSGSRFHHQIGKETRCSFWRFSNVPFQTLVERNLVVPHVGKAVRDPGTAEQLCQGILCEEETADWASLDAESCQPGTHMLVVVQREAVACLQMHMRVRQSAVRSPEEAQIHDWDHVVDGICLRAHQKCLEPLGRAGNC